MAEAKTAEQLQQELDAAMAKNQELTGQVRGLASERDVYKAQAQGGGNGSGNGGSSSHVLGKLLGVEADYSDVDAYYVPRSVHTQELQKAVNDAYSLARGDMMVMREIDRAVSTYKDLGTWDSPLSKKTLDILQKERLGGPRRDPTTGANMPYQGWEDLIYTEVRSLPKAARMAQAELVLEQQAAAAQAGANASAQGAASMASGGAPVVAAQGAISEEEFMKRAESGDTAGMKELLKQHAAAVTGAPV